jgi:NADPH-dependent 2,4-dienoyl-CoA reductase/sulfur reductase-like enzyme
VPNDGWLDGSGVDVRNGVLADAEGRTSHPNVWAAGDCAAWWDPAVGHRRREHWTSASNQAHVVAQSILGAGGTPGVNKNIHTLWSDQYGVRIQLAGDTSDGLSTHEVDGDASRLVLAYVDASNTIRGALAINDSRGFGRWKRQIGTALESA